MNKIKEMFELQNKLNNNTNGEGWTDGVTKDGKSILWGRCIYMEAAEICESFPWKHWKNIGASVDLENVKLEIVDIWHFMLSEMIKTFGLPAAIDIASEAYAEKLNVFPYVGDNDIDYNLSSVEDMMMYGLKLASLNTSKTSYANGVHEAFYAFRKMAETFGMTVDKIYPLYLGKNILNSFRQDHGYKDGTYIKEWNGREDNAVMMEILASNNDIGAAALYARLKEAYPG